MVLMNTTTFSTDTDDTVRSCEFCFTTDDVDEDRDICIDCAVDSYLGHDNVQNEYNFVDTEDDEI